ncbi:MAG TPA: hypothetical protein VFY10_01755 [Dehalococcoidia bacterium]|nr:hypothetical protein [Dehalococcoidia bacterium]
MSQAGERPLGNNLLLAYSKPRARENEQEFNDFFDYFYTQCMLDVAGIRTATRYRLSHQQMEWILPASREPLWPFGQEHTYLTVYEVDPSVGAEALFDAMHASPAFSMLRNPDDVPVVWGAQWLFEPITRRELSARLKPSENGQELKPTHIWVVPNTPRSKEVESANNHFYTTQSNLQYTGFLSVTRYRLASLQRPDMTTNSAPPDPWPHGRHSQLALWELYDLAKAMHHRRSANEAGASFPRYSWMPPIRDLRSADDHVIYEAITSRVEPIFR